MLNRRCFTLSALALAALAACGTSEANPTPDTPLEPGIKGLPADPDKIEPITKSDEEWRKLLPDDAYDVLREQGTERPFTGRYWNEHRAGIYLCSGCGLSLFDAADKFESGTGWPSFFQPVAAENVRELTDRSHGMVRTEILCARCGAHLGHVFEDGPWPTGKRHCVNSESLVFTDMADLATLADPAAD